MVVGKQVDVLVSKIRNQTEDIERQLRIQADRQIRDIQNVFQVPVANQTLFKQVDEHFKKLVGKLKQHQKIFSVSQKKFAELVKATIAHIIYNAP